LNQENPSSPKSQPPRTTSSAEEARRQPTNDKQMDLTVLSKLTIAELQKMAAT